MQPTFIPWLGYFDMIDKVDKFILLDDVQMVKRSWQVRNRIKISNTEHFVTISIQKSKNKERQKINEAQINYDTKWADTLLKSLQMNYSKAPFYLQVYEWFSQIISEKIVSLSELNTRIIKSICDNIGIKTSISMSCEIGASGSKDDLLSNICLEIGSNSYLSAKGSAIYIEADSPGGEFTKKEIALFYHEYLHPVYDQVGKEFIPYMSTLDLLMNYGFDNSLEIIRRGRQEDISYKEYNKTI
jgi:hypothetical protein